jgi:hypothetical protein
MQQIVRINTQASDFDFASLTAKAQPAVLTGWVEHWPALKASRQGPGALAQYLRPLDNNNEMDTLLLAADTQGKVGYAGTDLQQFNFERRRYPVWAVLQQLIRQSQQPDAVRIALQSARLDSCLPDFSRHNPMPGLSPDVVGRIWIGNQTVVPAHSDHSDNLACVLAGQRTFTLFPPEQAVNLYIGPLQSAPTGAPLSLVDILAPDFSRFPRYAEALAVAQQATLKPGEVLFLPALWWHHVQATTSFNLLVNYWWGGSVGSDATAPSPYNAMLHALLALNDCSAVERKQWQALFNYFVFQQDADDFSHIPAQTPAIQRCIEPKDRHDVLHWLLKELQTHSAAKKQ